MALRYMYPGIQLRIEGLTATVPLTQHTFANDCLLAKHENKVYQQAKRTKWRLLKGVFQDNASVNHHDLHGAMGLSLTIHV